MQGQRKSISHTMELPRQIVVGENNIEEVGEFLHGLSPNSKKVSIISGKNVKKIFGQQIDSSLKESKIHSIWHLASSNLVKDTKQIQKKVKNAKTDLVIGIGGGRSVDIAKLCSFNLRKPFVSIPTSASHDGIASPFVSV
ncbi:MAG: iron-containing alcohol dehydrogenase, partial [Thermoproteota archaeon]|nr:iron-containing alcohol dehydrogenase [Thermoproteota archaeon]